MRVSNDSNSLVLPLFGFDGRVIIGVKIISHQVFNVGEIERTRVVSRTIPRLVIL